MDRTNVVIISESGCGKRVLAKDAKKSSRCKSEKIIASYIVECNADDTILIMTKNGIQINASVKHIPLSDEDDDMCRLVMIEPGDCIVSASRVSAVH